MIKKILLGLSVICMSLSAQAGFIVDDAIITGRDMAGIEVTAMFGNGNMETGIWTAFPDVILATGNDILDAEGFSGGVVAQTWSLTQQGFTLANVNPANNDVLGAWTLTNLGEASGIVGFMIDGLPGNIAFDIVKGPALVTPNSRQGLPFVGDPSLTIDASSYTNQVNPGFDDLFFKLNVAFDSNPLAENQSFQFVADTDKLKIPEPTSLAMILTGLVFGATRLRSRKLTDNK